MLPGAGEAGPGDLLRVVVRSKRLEAANVVSLELASCDGDVLPAFTAGAHVDVHIPGELIRQYSLCNNPRENHRYVITVLREASSRGGSSALHDAREGQFLLISKPRNTFALVEGAPHSFLLAGGIGVTPLLAMAERLTDLQADFRLDYCSRSPGQMAFRDRLLGSRFAKRVHLHFDDGVEGQRMDANALLAHPEQGNHLYVCGPCGFIDYVMSSARNHGWRDEQLHREYFSANPVSAGTGDSFQVQLASTGKVLNVPSNRTVIDVLAAEGIEIPVSCEQGVCGTCLTGVLEGELDHRDMYLTDQERTAGLRFMPCCSRGKGLVLLDL